jgi:hypothetical protein
MGCINVNKQNNSVTITDKGLKTLIKARESKDKFDMEKFLKDCPTSIKTFDDFLEKFTSTDSLMCKHFILGFYIHIDEEQRREEVLKLINFINTRKEDYIGFENTLAELLAEVMTTEIETIVKLNQGMGDEWLNNLFSNALSQVEFVSNAKEMFGMMDDLQDGKVHEKLYRENPNLVIDYLRIIFPVMTKSNMIRALEKAFETGMDAIEVIERELKRLDYNDFFNDNSVSREVKDMVCETCLFSDHCDGVYCLRG